MPESSFRRFLKPARPICRPLRRDSGDVKPSTYVLVDVMSNHDLATKVECDDLLGPPSGFVAGLKDSFLRKRSAIPSNSSTPQNSTPTPTRTASLESSRSSLSSSSSSIQPNTQTLFSPLISPSKSSSLRFSKPHLESRSKDASSRSLFKRPTLTERSSKGFRSTRSPENRVNNALVESLQLPYITLTPPDDEHEYFTQSPFPSSLFLPLDPTTESDYGKLRVPNNGPEYNMRQWPHPASPWLRTVNIPSSQLQTQVGTRLASGNIVGWGHIQIKVRSSLQSQHAPLSHPRPIPLPPQIPTELDLKRRRQRRATIKRST